MGQVVSAIKGVYGGSKGVYKAIEAVFEEKYALDSFPYYIYNASLPFIVVEGIVSGVNENVKKNIVVNTGVLGASYFIGENTNVLSDLSSVRNKTVGTYITLNTIMALGGVLPILKGIGDEVDSSSKQRTEKTRDRLRNEGKPIRNDVSTLNIDESWNSGKIIFSPGDKDFFLAIQPDGNATINETKSRLPLWSTSTWNKGIKKPALYMQSDGNIVVLDLTTNKEYWASNTSGYWKNVDPSTSFLRFDEDGVLRLFLNGNWNWQNRTNGNGGRYYRSDDLYNKYVLQYSNNPFSND